MLLGYAVAFEGCLVDVQSQSRPVGDDDFTILDLEQFLLVDERQAMLPLFPRQERRVGERHFQDPAVGRQPSHCRREASSRPWVPCGTQSTPKLSAIAPIFLVVSRPPQFIVSGCRMS